MAADIEILDFVAFTSVQCLRPFASGRTDDSLGISRVASKIVDLAIFSCACVYEHYDVDTQDECGYSSPREDAHSLAFRSCPEF